MSMFDYDARPVTPQVVLVGNRASSVGYTIRDFWSRNGVPYEWVDLDAAERVRALVSPREMDPGLLPICVGATAVGRGGWSGRRSQRCCPPGRWLSRRPCAIPDCGPAVAAERPLLNQLPENSSTWWDARKIVDRLAFDARELLEYVRLVDAARATEVLGASE